MSFGVNLALAGAAMRGAREFTNEQADFDYTEKVRKDNLSRLESDAQLRPERANTEMAEFGVRRQTAQAQGQVLQDAADFRKISLDFTMRGLEEGRSKGMDFKDTYMQFIMPKYRDFWATRDPKKALETQQWLDSEQGARYYDGWVKLKANIAAGNEDESARIVQELFAQMHPGKNATFKKIKIPDATNPDRTKTAWQVTYNGRNGPETQQVDSNSFLQTLQIAAMTMLPPHKHFEMQQELIKDAREQQQKIEIERVKGDESRKTEMVKAGANGGDGWKPKEQSEAVHQALDELFGGENARFDPDAGKNHERAGMLAEQYLSRGLLDEYGNKASPRSAVYHAAAAIKGTMDEAKFRFANSGGVSPRGSATGVTTVSDPAVVQSIPDPGNSNPIQHEGKTYRWGVAPDANGNPDPTKRALYEVSRPDMAAPAAPAVSAAAEPQVKPLPRPEVHGEFIAHAPASRAEAVQRAADLDQRIAALKGQLGDPYQRPGVDPERMKKSISDQIAKLEAERAQLSISPEEAKSESSKAGLRRELQSLEATLKAVPPGALESQRRRIEEIKVALGQTATPAPSNIAVPEAGQRPEVQPAASPAPAPGRGVMRPEKRGAPLTSPEELDQDSADVYRREKGDGAGNYDQRKPRGTVRAPEKLKVDAQEEKPLGARPPAGNADKPIVLNKDGSFSTERTITVEFDGKHFVIPTIVNGKQKSPDEAIRLYKEGKNKAVAGPFNSAKEADAAAVKRSKDIGNARDGEAQQLRRGTKAPPKGGARDAPGALAREDWGWYSKNLSSMSTADQERYLGALQRRMKMAADEGRILKGTPGNMSERLIRETINRWMEGKPGNIKGLP